MRSVYLVLSILGFIAPNVFVARESIETGNWLLWLDPAATLKAMFGTTISTAFVVDLLGAVLVFFIWTWHESRKLGMKTPWMVWLLTLVFGMAGPFPLFLYLREKNSQG